MALLKWFGDPNMSGRCDSGIRSRSQYRIPCRNVRGGIPVLFPYAGKLVDEVFTPAFLPPADDLPKKLF